MASTTLPRENGRTMFVAFTWRGKYMNLQMFFPTLKTPTKKEIGAAIQGVYPGAVCKHYYVTDRDPSKALLRLPEEMKKNLKRDDFLFIEKDLNAKERRALPNKDFVFPGKGEGPEGKQRGSYPIPDKSHARNALAMAAAHASPEKEAKVKAAVKKKFPDIQQEEVGISSAAEMAKAKKEAELRRKEELAKKKVKKEEVQVDEEKKALPKLKMYRKAGNLARAGDEKSMKRQTKMISVLNKETSKGYKKAALDKLRSGGSPKHQTEEADLQKRIDRVNTDIASKPLENEKGKATTKEKQLARIKRQILLAKMRGLRKDPGAADSIAT